MPDQPKIYDVAINLLESAIMRCQKGEAHSLILRDLRQLYKTLDRPLCWFRRGSAVGGSQEVFTTEGWKRIPSKSRNRSRDVINAAFAHNQKKEGGNTS